jgi:hypothetical protein
MAKKPTKRNGAGRGKSQAAAADSDTVAAADSPAAPVKEPAFRDRIVDFRRVPAGDLAANPKNWRTHDTRQAEAMVGILQDVGVADACIARQCKDGSLELIDGHLRKDILAHELVPVLVLDVTAEEADKLLLCLDPIADMAGANKDALEELLRSNQTGEQALAELFTDLAKRHKIVNFAATEPAGDEDDVEVEASFQVVIDCKDEATQREVFERMTAEGFECRVLTL